MCVCVCVCVCGGKDGSSDKPISRPPHSKIPPWWQYPWLHWRYHFSLNYKYHCWGHLGANTQLYLISQLHGIPTTLFYPVSAYIHICMLELVGYSIYFLHSLVLLLGCVCVCVCVRVCAPCGQGNSFYTTCLCTLFSLQYVLISFHSTTLFFPRWYGQQPLCGWWNVPSHVARGVYGGFP